MQLIENQSLQAYNTFSIVAKARYFTVLETAEDIAEMVQWIQQNKQSYLLIGGGSNLLFKDDYSGLVAHVALKERVLIGDDAESVYIRAGAGENWHQFVLWTIDQGYAGLENLSLIPGTVGAAPVQNIGAYGVEVVDRFEALEAVDLQTGETRIFSRDDCQFSYRDSYFKSIKPDRYLITAVTFRLPRKPDWKLHYASIEAQLNGKEPSAKRISDIIIQTRQSKLPDPVKIANAGSFFKNPLLEKIEWLALQEKFTDIPGYEQHDKRYKTSAGWLIDQCGWKAYRQGDAGVYENHALVLVNHGTATGKEIWTVAQAIIDSVKKKFGITLEPEPRIISVT